MPRVYKSKEKQTKPERAGEQNFPDGYVEKRSGGDGFGEELKASTDLFKIATARRKKGTNWTEDELANEIDNFFQYCVDRNLKPSKASLSLWLGVSQSQYMAWQAEPLKYGVISEIINMAGSIMESSYVQRGEKYPTMNMFLLKSRHNYVEASKLDITTNGQAINSAEDVKDLVSKLGLDKTK